MISLSSPMTLSPLSTWKYFHVFHSKLVIQKLLSHLCRTILIELLLVPVIRYYGIDLSTSCLLTASRSATKANREKFYCSLFYRLSKDWYLYNDTTQHNFLPSADKGVRPKEKVENNLLLKVFSFSPRFAETFPRLNIQSLTWSHDVMSF